MTLLPGRRLPAAATLLTTLALACGAEPVVPGPLRVNELTADNEGNWLDGEGEKDDWIELVNVGPDRVWLDDYALDDGGRRHPLPGIPLAAGERIVLWADAEESQGELHLPFKLSSEGETLRLRERDGPLRDLVPFPPLSENETFARFPDGTGDFALCRYATATRDNGETCGPPPPREIPDEPFTPFTWPDPYPRVEGPLSLTELALRPADFIEVTNVGDAPVDLADYELRLAAQAPGEPWPGAADGVALAWPRAVAMPGERIVVPVGDADVAAIASTTDFEGVVSLFRAATPEPTQRVDFMAWPERAVLARLPGDTDRLAFVEGATPGMDSHASVPLTERAIPGRVRHLRTPDDFRRLAAGGTHLGLQAIKFVVDMDAGDVVHLLGSDAWDLHYTFVRELIELEPHLDRCDPEENQLFHFGWSRFSQEQYFASDTRRYLLGTLVIHAGAGVQSMEFVTGDQISAEQMRRAFFAVAPHLREPGVWSVRPQGPRQNEALRTVEGTLPIVSEGAPLRDRTFEPLSPGIGYGELRFIPASELRTARLGPEVIVVTDEVPNDFPLVGGIVTEAFQTPLSHVNVLSRGRGTPNLAFRAAREDERFAPLFGELVRFEVSEGGFSLERADPIEATAFWEARRPNGPRAIPRLDATLRGPTPLSDRSIDDLPALGAKAAQLAELGRVVSSRPGCPGPVPVPAEAFAIPVAHYLDHFETSGARAELEALEEDPAFRTDPAVRAEGLTRVRARVLAHPVDPDLLDDVDAFLASRYGTERVRFRSSSNAEDLSDFNGAGLYTSVGASRGDPERPIDDAIRTVWASLWNQRAYEERELAHIDQSAVAMGILVHGAFLSELANGVGISRSILDPTRGDMHYFNVQFGEATVTNPAPGVTTEQYLYRFGRTPRIVNLERSSLIPYDVLPESTMDEVACTLAAIHDHFRPLLDPEREEPWFAMDIEFKTVRPDGALVVKQARPYSFGDADRPTDCREF